MKIVDTTLQAISCVHKPFRNKLIILDGDFCQIVLVVNGTGKNIIEETIKFSVFWPLFKVLKLNETLKCIIKEFSDLLLKIGDVKIEN